MTQTQTTPNSHAIIFNDQSKKFITQKENDFIYTQIEKRVDGFFLENIYLRFSSIAKLLTLQEFYEQYPKDRPQYVDKYKELPGLGISGTINLAKGDALRGMIIGLKKYIASDRYQIGKEPLELLNQMEAKLT